LKTITMNSRHVLLLAFALGSGCSNGALQPSTGAAGTNGGTAGASGTGTGGSMASGTAALHRGVPETCAYVAADGAVMSVDAGGPADGGSTSTCTQDSDCASCENGHLGRCEGPFSTCVCDQCVTDQDCGASGVCACDGQTFGFSHTRRGNVCIASNCRVDADCGPRGFCSPTTDISCGAFYGIAGYYCHTPSDQCTNDADCAQGTCRYSPQVGYWVCAVGACAG